MIARAGCYTSNFVSANLRIIEVLGGTYVAYDENIFLSSGNVGVVVT